MRPEGAYRQCTRCVMDTYDPDITFDELGQCNHCTAYLARPSTRAATDDAGLRQKYDEFVARLREARGQSKYDCVIGVSGGTDSSYSAYLMVKAGLRVLAVHMDNGWNTAIAARNVKTLIDRLGIDYMSYVLDWDEFKDLQLAFLKASVPEIETPTDIAIPAALHQIAAAHGIRHIVTGGNIHTEGILPKAWHYDAKDMKYIRSIHRLFGTRKLRKFPIFDYQRETYYKFVKGIRLVYPLELVPYSKEHVEQILKAETGWRPPGGKHHESTITRFVQSYILPVKFKIDYRRATFSTQICAGTLTRERALELLKKPPFDPLQVATDKHFVAKKFGITVRELEEIIALPPKLYRDYPNDQRFLEGIYRTYRVLYPGRRPIRSTGNGGTSARAESAEGSGRLRAALASPSTAS